MKLDVDVHEVVLANTGPTGEFKIRNSAKAFKILSDGLYSNKIRAIVRELSCNAVDSHTAAGRSTVPFDVHLPSILEPWFAIRDYGTGLDGNQVTNIYTTYFESTKTQSNDFIGALGLGSKSPFSYTENFTVTAIKDGMKRIYSAFINEAGVPSIAQMGEAETTEPPGVEVKFSVTDRNDYHTWRAEARGVYRYFKLRPNVLNAGDGFEIDDPDYKEKDIVPGVHLRKNAAREYGGSGSIAIMGNIAYPITVDSRQFGNLAALLECGLAIEFGIGELDFAASREQLSYVPLTINSIKKKLEELNAVLETHLAAKADAIENLWERAVFLHKEMNGSRLYMNAAQLYIRKNNFELIDANQYYQLSRLKLTVDDATKKGLEIVQLYASHGSCSSIKAHSEYSTNGKYIPTYVIQVSDDAVFVLNDLKTGAVSRVRYHYNKSNYRGNIYIINHDAKDPADRVAKYEAFLKSIKNPPTVVKASELDKPAPRVSGNTQGVMVLRPSMASGCENDLVWAPATIDANDKKTKHYYVNLVGSIAHDRNDIRTIDVKMLAKLLNVSGIAALSEIKIYGVRKNARELTKKKNWIWLEDFIREEVAKITENDIAGYLAAEMLDSYNRRIYREEAVIQHLNNPKSPYAEYVIKCKNIKRATGNVAELIKLCSLYGNSLELNKIRDKFVEDRKAYTDRYPLLTHLTNQVVSFHYVADYINMIDQCKPT